ncbi:MAG: hypothetical protein ACRD1X_01495, partial [Vicinamibacteria bacterium]
MELQREPECHSAGERARLWSISRLPFLFRQGRRVGSPFLLVLIILATGSSCGPSADDGLVLRFIDEDPTEKFSSTGHLDPVPVFHWTFQNRDDLAPWQGVNVDLQTAFDGHSFRIVFPASSDLWHRPSLVRGVDLEARALDVISIQLRGSSEECPVGGQVQLYWSGPNESFSEERSLTDPAEPDGGYSTGTAAFSLSGHPLWVGRVSSIRIDPAFTPGCTLEVLSVDGLKYEMPEGRLAAAMGQPRKVTIGQDVRSALLAPPGHTLSRQFEVPRDAVFSFSYGVANGITQPVQFDVFIELGGERQRLFGAVLHPDSLYSDRGWQDADVDLSRFAGKRVTIELETTSGEAFDSNVSSPAWGNPEVWRRSLDSTRPNVILISLDT